MTGKIAVRDLGKARPGLLGRKICSAALAAWVVISMAPAVNASEPAGNHGNVLYRFNHQELASAAGPAANSPSAAAAGDEIGIVVLRSDGGDPRQLRVDD